MKEKKIKYSRKLFEKCLDNSIPMGMGCGEGGEEAGSDEFLMFLGPLSGNVARIYIGTHGSYVKRY